MKIDHGDVLWRADLDLVHSSVYAQYLRWLRDENNLEFQSYSDLYEWSIVHVEDFWKTIYDFFEVIEHGTPIVVRDKNAMPDTQWFDGSKLNYAEHVFRNKNESHPALVSVLEGGKHTEISWDELEDKVARLRSWLIDQGIKKGDRVVGFLPNIPEALIAFLATNSIGAVWSCCSPDFGKDSLLDRFGQLEPSILIACDGYRYNGKEFTKLDIVREMAQALPTLKKTVLVPFLNKSSRTPHRSFISWEECLLRWRPLGFEPVDFMHPIWVLFSSGTTGRPKAITHGHGGMLLEHLKYLALHNDVRYGERFFWFTTTGWMMWNFLQASLLVGATAVLYEGSPTYPFFDRLWKMADELSIQHFGTGAPYLVACMKKGLSPKESYALTSLRSVGSTGAPLPPEAFDWCYENIKENLWLCSMSGGTDVCTAFVGSQISLPVRRGRIQTRALGCALFSYDEQGVAQTKTVGEMVIAEPMPCMPIFFWNDDNKERYRASYFEHFPGIWRHGDWVEIDTDGSLRILGRSDATLNRKGVRIGSAEIYRILHGISAIHDALIINVELADGSHWMPLFVVLDKENILNDSLKKNIITELRSKGSPRHVPDEIIQVQDIPYTLSGKKLEAPIKKLFLQLPVDKVVNKDALRNPEAVDTFEQLANKFNQDHGYS